MIRNFVLDMGNVIRRWDPDAIAAQYALDDEQRAALKDGVFGTEDWTRVNRGDMTEEELLKRCVERMPVRHHAALRKMMDNWFLQMPPMPGAAEFVRRVKARGYGVYLLSNAPLRYPACIREDEAYRQMDGVLVSAHVRALKPEKRIYEMLLEKYGLRADECFFLDDMPENVEGARAAGLEGAVFDGDFKALVERLSAEGIAL